MEKTKMLAGGHMVRCARIGDGGVGLSLRHVAPLIGLSSEQLSAIETGAVAADYDEIIRRIREIPAT